MTNFTMDSLRHDHPLVPYNPLLAESLYLARYIELVDGHFDYGTNRTNVSNSGVTSCKANYNVNGNNPDLRQKYANYAIKQ